MEVVMESCGDRPSLAQIARLTWWAPEFDLESDTIDQALIQAGVNPRDAKERRRFTTLVEDTYFQRVDEKLAELGLHAEAARELLGECASREDVIDKAQEIKDDSDDGWGEDD